VLSWFTLLIRNRPVAGVVLNFAPRREADEVSVYQTTTL
jgi:hypothetical protein